MWETTRFRPARWGPGLSRRRLLRAGSVAVAGGAAAWLAACGGGDDKSPSPGGATSGGAAGGTAGTSTSGAAAAIPTTPADLFYLPWGFFPREYDAHTALGPEIWHVIGSRAIRRQAKTGDLLPEAVAKWEQPDPQGMELVLKIRPDIATHDKAPTNGRLFTAEDMAYNLTRITGALDPANKARYQRAATLVGMDKAEAVDATTVRVKMAKPSSAFFAGLAEFRNMLMPKDVVENVGFANPSALSGTGPFMVQEFEDYKVAKFVRHQKFFEQTQPHFNRLEYQPTIDRATQVSAFLAKQIAMLGGIRSTEKPIFEGQRKDARFVEHTGLNWWHVRFNIKRQPFSDPRVRKAIALVIDREELAKARYGTMKWSLTGPIVPGFPEALSADQLKAYPGVDSSKRQQQIQEARQLLTQAGVNNLEVKLLPGSATPTDEWFENAVRMKDQLDKALPNVKTTVTPPADTAAFAQLQAAGDFDLISYTITTLPDQVLELTSQFHTTGSRNYGKFTDPEADSILDKALITLDAASRSNLVKDFQDKILKDWLPVVHFYVNPDVRFVDPRFVLENDEEQLGPWNAGGVGYGGQSLRFWYQKG